MNVTFCVVIPLGVVTTIFWGPAAPLGVVALIEVVENTDTDVAATPLMVTLVAPVKFVPPIVICVPPAVGPEDGVTAVMVGAGA